MASRWSRWLSDKVDALTGRPSDDVTPEPRRAPEPEPQPHPLEGELQAVRRQLEDAELMLMGKEAEFKNKLNEAQERNAELLDKVVVLTQKERELQARILDAQFDGSGARAEAKRLDGELRDLRRSLKTRDQEAAQLRAMVTRLEAGARPRESPAPETDNRWAMEAEERLQALSQERDELQSLLRRAEKERAAMEARLSDTEAQPTADPPQPAQPPPHQATGLREWPLKAVAAGKTARSARRAQVVREEREGLAATARERAAAGFGRLGPLPRSRGEPPATDSGHRGREGRSRRRPRGRRRS